MLLKKIKTRKCKNPKCRSEFQPTTEWQKFCKPRCRFAAANKRNADILRSAKQMIREREAVGQ